MSGIAVRFDTPITLEVAELRYRSGRKPRGDDLLAIHKIEDGIAHVTVTRRGHRPKSYQAPLKLVIEIPDAQHAADNANGIGPPMDDATSAQDSTLPDKKT